MNSPLSDRRVRPVIDASPAPGGALQLRLACGHMMRWTLGAAPERLFCPACPSDVNRDGYEESDRRCGPKRNATPALDTLPPIDLGRGDRERQLDALNGSQGLMAALCRAGFAVPPPGFGFASGGSGPA